MRYTYLIITRGGYASFVTTLALKNIRVIPHVVFERDKSPSSIISRVNDYIALERSSHVHYPIVDENTEKMYSLVEEVDPHYIFLINCSRIDPDILSLAKKDVLSVNMGLLPWIRDPHGIEKSVYYRVPIGVTLYVADEKPCIGEIVNRKLVEIAEDDNMVNIRERVAITCADIIVEFVETTEKYGSKIPFARKLQKLKLAKPNLKITYNVYKDIINDVNEQKIAYKMYVEELSRKNYMTTGTYTDSEITTMCDELLP